jgi:hypothetical protein
MKAKEKKDIINGPAAATNQPREQLSLPVVMKEGQYSYVYRVREP